MRKDFKPGDVVSCHAWSADGSRVAVCPNNNELHIYVHQPEQHWALEHVLQQHDKLISGVDWSWSTGGLVTCSHDLSAYVLKLKDGTWKPDMVITRLRRAALCVRWSPCGSRFAVGGAGKEVSVCFTEKESGWWGAAVIRKHQSSVMGVAWHPNGTLLATACADGRCRVFSALPKVLSAFQRSKKQGWLLSPPSLHLEQESLSGSDDKEHGAGRARSLAFGELLHDVDFGAGWGTAVSWSPNGLCVAMSCHQSVLGFLRAVSSEAWILSLPPAMQRLASEELPFRSLVFLSESLLVAASFDGEPFLCSLDGAAQWGDGQRLTGRVGTGREALTERQLASDFSAKLALFRSSPSSKVLSLPTAVSCGWTHRMSVAVICCRDLTELPQSILDLLATLNLVPCQLKYALVMGSKSKERLVAHSNAIVEVRHIGASKFSTAGLDGRILMWDANT